MLESTKYYMEKQEQTNQDMISLCELMKGDTSEVIRKLESQLPSFVQNYSDLYSAYLHMFDDVFGTCYIAEKQYFDKFQIDPKILSLFKEYSQSLKHSMIESIEMNTKLFNVYVKTRISTIKSLDEYLHTMMDLYAETSSRFLDNTHPK